MAQKHVGIAAASFLTCDFKLTGLLSPPLVVVTDGGIYQRVHHSVHKCSGGVNTLVLNLGHITASTAPQPCPLELLL